MIVEETIPSALDKERLDRIVALMLDVSRSDAADLIAGGGALVDNERGVTGKTRLVTGQVVVVDTAFLPVRPRPSAEPEVAVDVVHEDTDIVVVNKAPGVVVHPGAGNPTGTLVNGLLALYPEIADVGEEMRPGIVHRLDVGTSGLLVVARTQDAYENLVGALSVHEVDREYVALTWGRFDTRTGTIDAEIGRDHRDPMKMAVVKDGTGKWARTHFEVVHEYDTPAELSVLRVSLETGRTHQIRVHLAAVSHPVVGDATYGGAKSALVAPRPMLHAERLRFRHPVTETECEFEAPISADMLRVLGECSPQWP